MERDEALKHTDHYRCTRCGRLSPLAESICSNPVCRAQLTIYGEMIMAEEINKETKVTGSTDSGSSGKSKPEKPKKEKKQRRGKKQKATPVTQDETHLGKLFMQKKTFLIWLDVIFLLVYSVMTYCADWTDMRFSTTEVLLCIGIMIAVTVLAIIFAQKGKHGFHGILCFLIGALSFAAAGGILIPDNDTMPMFLTMVAAYWWLGIISFVGTSRRKRTMEAGGNSAVFLKKETVMICLNLVFFVICGTLICFRSGLYNMFLSYKYRIDFAECLLPWTFQLTVTGLSIVLVCKRKYVLRGVLHCAVGAVSLILVLGYSNILIYMLSSAVIAVLHIWLGVISFLKEE